MRRSWQQDRGVAERALAALAWRGPDGRVLREVGDWFLGVARLAITDAAADQPIRCAETGKVVVFNGAVTSAAREWEEARGAATRNDAELVLVRLRRGGPQALCATCGPYALAVLDPQTEELWLARDPEGEKPLYVVTREGLVVAFASSVAALRELGLDVRLDQENAARFLRYGFALAPSWQGAGYELHADLRGAWVARPGERLRQVGGAAAPPEAHSTRELLERVVEAVDRCARAEVPVGLCLSGGVDSSCLAAALRRRGHALPAYQFRADGAPSEERERARRVAAATGLLLRPVGGGPEIVEALPWLTRCVGLPQGDPSVLATHALARAARADGVRVLLSGEGADDLWLGYRRHRAARHLPARGLARWPAPQLAMGTLGRLARAVTSRAPYDALLQVVPPGFLSAALARDALPAGDLPGAGDGALALDRARFADRAFYLRHDLLPKCDTALMAAGVEGRCPYLDPEVLWCPEVNARDARAILGKRALKRAFAGLLPAGVLRRRKLGFGIPIDRWLRQSDLLADVLVDARTLGRPHLRAAGVRAMLDRHRAGRARLGHALYLVAAYEIYLRYLEEAA